MILRGDDYIDAGTRLGEPENIRFFYPDGTPIKVLPMGNTSKESYQNFLSAFNNKYQKRGGDVKKGRRRKVRLRK